MKTIRLLHRRQESILTYYDNLNFEGDIPSKWSIVRQRLHDILALSPTYKPSNVRRQLILLVALMTRQAKQINRLQQNSTIEKLTHLPNLIGVKIGDRTRFISLRRIPVQQMIYVDVDGQDFSIQTRQFLLAISQGYAYETAAKFCPPAVTDMLIDMSKTKIFNDRRQYKRALLKRRLGKTIFFSLFSFVSLMIFALILSVGSSVLNLMSFEHTDSNVSMIVYSLYENTTEY